MPIFLNLLIFFLLIATVDKAFIDYGLVSEILDTIEIYKQAGPLEDKILKVIYIRIKFARQTNRDIYGKLYVYPLSEVNRPANYLGITSRQDKVKFATPKRHAGRKTQNLTKTEEDLRITENSYISTVAT
ncbi:hypothetical protein N7467_001238 [Penicillium canescens]|nr:hypothetical protein N7467_001238 [Penicillium canescens]